MKQKAGSLKSLIKLTKFYKANKKRERERRHKFPVLAMKEDISLQTLKTTAIISDCSYNNSDEMDQFLQTRKLPQPTQSEIDHLNRPITIRKLNL